MNQKQLRRLQKRYLKTLSGQSSDPAPAETANVTGRVFAGCLVRKVSEKILSNKLDPFNSAYTELDLVPPLYDPTSLAMMTLNCDVLTQCIQALQVNVNGMGWHLEYQPPDDQPDRQEDDGDKVERRKLEALFNYPNARETWVELKNSVLGDILLIGRGYLEVVRRLNEDIAELHYVQSRTIRISNPDAQATEHTQWIRESTGWTEIRRQTRFRRFCQWVGTKRAWFKEFGDPRSLNKETGKFAPEGTRWAFELEATELIIFGSESPNSVYGEPPWLSELIGIMGSSEAKKINFLYFNEKTIPPYIITVSGGTLGPNSVEQLEEFLRNEFKGSDNFHKVLLLEATPVGAGAVGDEKTSPVKIEVQPMTQFMQEDALFLNYIRANAKAIRGSFRLPPLLIGEAEEYSHASVLEAKIVAEQQVFAPFRNELDEKINRTIIADFGAQRHHMRSHGTVLSDDTQVVSALGVTMDVMPVGHVVDFVSELMGKKPPIYDAATRAMTVMEYRRNFAPVFDPFALDDDDPDNADDDRQQKHLVKILAGIRKQLAARHQSKT